MENGCILQRLLAVIFGSLLANTYLRSDFARRMQMHWQEKEWRTFGQGDRSFVLSDSDNWGGELGAADAVIQFVDQNCKPNSASG
jgi:hypothetical protein